MSPETNLYGVCHHYTIQREDGIFGLNVETTEGIVVPSRKLIEDLEKLPKGSAVGIEYHPDLDKFGLRYPASRIYERNSYWRFLLKSLNSLGLQPVYLEDMEVYRQYLCRHYRAADLKMKQEMEIEKHDCKFDKLPLGKRSRGKYKQKSFRFETRMRKMDQQIYRLEVEAQFYAEAKREEAIFANIKKSSPTAAIVGMAHGDIFILNHKGSLGASISFASYSQEDVNVNPYCSDIVYETSRRMVSTPEEKYLVDRELLTRRFNAVTQGRISPTETPDYIGTWDLNFPARGLFEIYLKPPTDGYFRKGWIRDGLGSAYFQGFITNEGLCFTKNYVLSESSESAAQVPVYYSGTLLNGVYEGQYWMVHKDGGNTQGDSFQIRPYTSQTPSQLVDLAEIEIPDQNFY